MGFRRNLVIEVNTFGLRKEGSFLLITESSWKIVKGSETWDWFSAMVCKSSRGVLEGGDEGFLYHLNGGC